MTKEDLQATIYASTEGHGQDRLTDVRALRAFQIARKLRVPLELGEIDLRILKHTHHIVSRFVDPATATMSELEDVATHLDAPRTTPTDKGREVADRISQYFFGCQLSELTSEEKQALTRAWWAYMRRQETECMLS